MTDRKVISLDAGQPDANCDIYESRIDALEGRVDQLADEVRKVREQLGEGNWRNIGRRLTT
ncbi:MAG: hypothetical protein ACLPSW_29435 [Roseiarcus sp.]